MKRKNYSKELKTKVALVAIKGNQTVNEIVSEFGIHVSLMNRWKKAAIDALPLVFGKSQTKHAGYNGFGGGYLKPPIEAEAKRFCSQFS